MIIVNLVTANNVQLLGEQGLSGYEISGATVKQKLNEVPSASLRFPATNLHARNAIGMNRPAIEIIENDKRVFYGAAISTKVDIWGNTEIQCDGALSFLSDIVKAPFTLNNKTHAEYIATILDQYNAVVSDERKVWFGGVVGFENDGNVDIDHSEEYTDMLTLLKESVDKYGGYMFESYVDGTGSALHPYVGWMKEPTIDSGKVLEFGKNELTLVNFFDFDEYASRVYATGQNGITFAREYVQDTDAEAAWGRRDYAYKTSAPNAVVLATLALAELVRRSTPIRTVELTALDLEQLGASYSGFTLGTTATLLDQHFGINLTLMVNTVERDLLAPQNSKIALGQSPIALTTSIR